MARKSRIRIRPDQLFIGLRIRIRGRTLAVVLCVKGLCLGLVGVGWERLKAVSGYIPYFTSSMNFSSFSCTGKSDSLKKGIGMS